MGASVALAGLGACTKQPIEKIVPYVDRPEEVIPGKPLNFATAATFAGYGQGIVVTSHEGRPTKIEGNPEHPASFGATSIWAQADLLDLYNPDRAKTITKGDSISTRGVFFQELNQALSAQKGRGGAGLRFLTQNVTSPTLAAQLQAMREKFPSARWHQWEPLSRDGLREARAGGVFGARDVAFPKLNLLSWYLFIGGGALALWSFIHGGVDTGWTFYTPFSTTYANSHVISMAAGIFVAGFGSILTGLNFIVTIHKMRAPGLTWFRLPLFIRSHYATTSWWAEWSWPSWVDYITGGRKLRAGFTRSSSARWPRLSLSSGSI
ncbi:hypothetical protein BH18VER2_BH18VER2_00930 [soil metagenome]